MKIAVSGLVLDQSFKYQKEAETKQFIKKDKKIDGKSYFQIKTNSLKQANKLKSNEVDEQVSGILSSNLSEQSNTAQNIYDIPQSLQKEEKNKQEYFCYQNYSFRKLTSQYRHPALELLTQSFIQHQPLAVSFYTQFPEQKIKAYEFWNQYWDMYMDNAIQSGISVVVLDTDKSNELIGIYLLKNYNYQPANLDDRYLEGYNILSAEVELQKRLIKDSSLQVQDILLRSSSVAQGWAAAIKDGHQGKGLYFKMTELAQKVIKQAGYEYALVFASSFLTSKVLKKLQFTEIAGMNGTQFELLEKKPFALIQKLHERPSLWFKTLKV